MKMMTQKARHFLLITVVLAIIIAFICQMGKGEEDFLVYWSAARLLVTGGNPFDLNSLHVLELETRPERLQREGRALAAWNPPWLLLLLLPFGLLPFDLAARVWMFCNFTLIGAAVALTWQLLLGPVDMRSMLVSLAAGWYFGASLVTIQMGQISTLLLLGLVVSAYWLHIWRDKLAGAALFLTTIKPQVTYLVVLLAVSWAVRHR
ncbi:MAG: glycosyltransferase family 87 protein, partial [Anaerolineae bacterium]